MKKAIAILLCVAVVGCQPDVSTEAGKSTMRPYLPENAQDIQSKGNGWLTFRLDGRLFLFHHSFAGNAAVESITELSERAER